MIDRRHFLRTLLAGFSTLCAGAAYSIGYAPLEAPRITRYRLAPKRWPAGLPLRIAAIADLHACEPWMSARRIEAIVDQTNALKPDLIVLLGDYISGMRLRLSQVPPADWAAALARLSAPLGIHAILGNHDWWNDPEAQRRQAGPTMARRALEAVGIPVYENDVARLTHRGASFWLAGLADQDALLRKRNWPVGLDDLPGTLMKVTDDAPLILLAHEPDIFVKVPERVALTLSGHTHGGQVRLFGWAPVVPSRFGGRFVYGHIVEADRHLIVSGGLGCSGFPIRIGAPPEILLIELGEGHAA